jgi:hypothetical protein
MKKLYSFSIDKDVDVEETTVNPDGSKTINTVKKKVPQKFFLRKPTRSLQDEAELFYAVQLSENIKLGCLTHAQLAKRYANDEGTFSDNEKKEYAELYVLLFKKQEEYQKANIKKDSERTEEEKTAYSALVKDIAEITEKIQKFEYSQITLFDQTAENIARNKTIRWWMLMLCYKQNPDDSEEELFGSGSLEDRLKKFDEISDSDSAFDMELIKRMIYYVSFWYVGRATKQEDFEKLGAI